MRSRRFLIAAVFAAVLLVGTVAAYAYDNSQRDTIAKGVAVGGVDVGGLKPQQARQRLERELIQPLRTPVVVTWERQRFVLSPRQARFAVDLDGTVAQAVERSRDGSFLARVRRGVTGGSLDADVRPRITYDSEAVDRFARRVTDRIERPAKDASLAFSGSSLGAVQGRDGVTVDGRRLRRSVARALRRAADARVVRVRATVVRPKVTTAQLAKRYPTVITVDRANFKLNLWKNLRLAKSYTVAIGQLGFDTPAGLYRIQNKAVDPVWSVPNSAWAGDLAGQQIPPGPSNPLKARWLGIYDGAGIHGTDIVSSLGTRASRGCVRMAISDVIELYDQTPVGAPIYIA